MKIPAQLMAGDSVTFKDASTRDNSGQAISAPDWALHYAIRGPSSLDLTASALGGGWVTAISTAQSVGLAAGVHYWQAYATKGSERVTLGTGQLEVFANIATAGASFDGRSQDEKDLAAVQNAMRQMIAGGAVQRYAIGNRQVDKMEMSQLIALESRLKSRVARGRKGQSIANGLGNPDKLLVRFKK